MILLQLKSNHILKCYIYIYMYIIYTPNLGSEIALPGREREQGRFRGSTEGAKGRNEWNDERARGSITGQCRGKANRSRFL